MRIKEKTISITYQLCRIREICQSPREGDFLIVFNPPNDNTPTGATLLNVLRGKVISFIKQTPNRDLRYRIQTPTAVSLVRGTGFRTKVGDNAETIFEVLEGIVNVRSDGEEIDLDGDFGIKI